MAGLAAEKGEVMITSLVSGGAGFIGSHVANHLLQMGHRVVVLDDLSGGSNENLPQSFQMLGSNPVKWYNEPKGTLIEGDCLFVHGSILDEYLVDHLFAMYKPDYVYHLAAYAAEALSAHIRRFNYENNLIGSVNLINAAVNAGTVKRFVFTSSVAVYGHRAYGADEYQHPTPIDPYGIAKYAVEMDLKAAHEMFGLPYTIFRMHNVYGIRQSLSDPYRNVLGLFIRACLCGEPMRIFGDGTQTRAFTYIDDVAPLIAQSINLPMAENQVINLGTDMNVQVLESAHMVAEAMGVEPRIEFLPARAEAKFARSNHNRAKRIFGPREHVGLSDGLARTAKWAKTQVLKEPRVFEGVEIEKGLPASWRQLVHVDR